MEPPRGFRFFENFLYPAKNRKKKGVVVFLRSELISQEKNIANIKVEVQAEDFRLKIDEAAEFLRSKANIKGFRKGHVPRKVLELHLGSNAIRAEALEKLVPEVISSIVDEYGLDLIAEPKVEIVTIEPEKPVELMLIFETRPEVELPDLETIKIFKKNVPVTEKILNDAIMALRENNADRKPVEDRNAIEGDLVEIEYDVVIDGKETNEHDPAPGKQKGVLELGSSSVRKELSTALEGCKAGDSVEVEVPVKPEDGSNEKTVRYNIEIISVSEKVLPALDSAFFQKVTGEPDLSETEFREKVMENLQTNFMKESRKDAENRALAAVVERSKVEIPESLAEKQKQAIISEMAGRVKKQTGQSLEEYFTEKGLERGPFEEGAASEALEVVKRSLVLESISDREMIQVENSDIEQEINDMSRSFGIPLDQMQQFFLKNNDGIADLVHRVKMRKTVDRIMEMITLEEGISEESDLSIAPLEKEDS